MGEQYAGVGILTFHCSDNFGAMLQAYGLKQFLCRSGVRSLPETRRSAYLRGLRRVRIAEKFLRIPGILHTKGQYAAVPDGTSGQ